MFDTYIATTNGVFRLRDDALEALGLESERVSATHAWREGDALVVLAGSYGNGLFRKALSEARRRGYTQWSAPADAIVSNRVSNGPEIPDD